jgi:hypothetical protein
MRSRLVILVASLVVACVAVVLWARACRLRRASDTGRPPAAQPVSGRASQPGATQPVAQAAARSAGGVAAAIRGRVVDPEGRPIAGVRIMAAAATGLGAAPPPGAGSQPAVHSGGELGVFEGPLPFPDQIAVPTSSPTSAPASAAAPAMAAAAGGSASGTAAAERDVGSAVSAADGTFVLLGLPAARLVLRFTHVAHPCGQVLPVSLEGGGERVGLQIALGRGLTVSGRVTDSRGAVVPRAVVAPELADSVGTESDGAGRYRFGPVCGAVRLVANAPGLRSQTRQVEPTATGSEVSLDFQLERDAESLRGRVLDHRDRPVAGVSVTATGAGEGRRPVSTVSGGRGEFVLGGLGPGPYRLETRHETHASLRRDGVQPGEEVTLRLPASGGIAGLVREERGGTAVPRYEVTVAPRGGGVPAPPVRRTGARFEARPLAAGPWRVTVRAPGYVTFVRDRDVPGGERPGTVAIVDVLVELVRGATLSGEVRDDRGDRVVGATVRLGGASTRSGPRGEFRLGELPAGGQVLQAHRDGYEPAEVPVQLRAGDETRGVDVRLTRRP